MTRVSASIRLALAIAAIPSAGNAQPVGSATAFNMCMKNPVPPGYVVTARLKTDDCSGMGTTLNTVTIDKVEGKSSMSICMLNEIPAGSSVVRVMPIGSNTRSCMARA